jgi:hypothetical protein
MLFLKLLLVAYLIVSALAVLLAFAAIDSRPLRIAFIVIGVAMPLLCAYALISNIWSEKRVPRFDEEMAGIEDDIEIERIKLFGGEKTCPSFSERWEKAYKLYVESLVKTTYDKIISIKQVVFPRAA